MAAPTNLPFRTNAILSQSALRSGAQQRSVPHRHFADLLGQHRKPCPPTINLFSGGKHAGGQSPIQDVLIVPASARTMDEALSMVLRFTMCRRIVGPEVWNASVGGGRRRFERRRSRTQAMLGTRSKRFRAAHLEPGTRRRAGCRCGFQIFTRRAAIGSVKKSRAAP